MISKSKVIAMSERNIIYCIKSNSRPKGTQEETTIAELKLATVDSDL